MSNRLVWIILLILLGGSAFANCHCDSDGCRTHSDCGACDNACRCALTPRCSISLDIMCISYSHVSTVQVLRVLGTDIFRPPNAFG